MITIVIPVRDGGEGLDRCLKGISKQRVKEPVELIVIDSGSQDGSIALAESYGATVISIPPADFNHGSARNLAARAGSGELIVFTVQDAHAEDENWLASLVEPLQSNPAVAGVYGRQLPHGDATPPEVWFLNFLYGPRKRVQVVHSEPELSLETTMFSNVNSAIRRNKWEPDGFVEDIIMSEDHEWARRVLLEGATIVYEPGAAVRHSHRYTALAAFRRFFDSGASADRAYLAGADEASEKLNVAAGRYGRGEIGWLLRSGQGIWIPYAVFYELSKWLGLQLGHRHRQLPLPVKRWCSALPDYWLAFPDGGAR